MEDATNKEKVLKKVRSALISSAENPYPDVDLDSPIYHEIIDSLDICFAKEFTKVGGKFVYCESMVDLASNLKECISNAGWKNIFCKDETIGKMLSDANIRFSNKEEDFLKMEVGITSCEYLVARLGSVFISSAQVSGRKLNVYPPTHIVIAKSSQLVPDIKHALNEIKNKYEFNFPSLITMITGPSRTADIEKTLVMGAHGPKDLFVFLLDDQL